VDRLTARRHHTPQALEPVLHERPVPANFQPPANSGETSHFP
jgi:hypothetical protein